MGIFAYMKKENIDCIMFTQKCKPIKKLSRDSSYKYLLKMMKELGHEKVMFSYDKKTNSRFIIAIHSTKRGPALGGSRFYPYKKEEDAIFDILRLSRGMTHKAAGVNLRLGGGKACCWLDEKGKSKAKIIEYAKALAKLNHSFITGEDVGTSVPDMDTIYLYQKNKLHLRLPNDVCFSKKLGGAGDPSPYTSVGVFEGIRASVEYKLKKKSLKGVSVSVQGLGKVGYPLCEQLIDSGAKLFVTDMHKDPFSKLQKYAMKKKKAEIEWVEPQDIYSVDCDVFSPCAMGAILNSETIPKLKCSVVAGSANNQLKDEIKDGERLRKKGILYAPDFIINAGGLICAAEDYFAHKKKKKWSKLGVNKRMKLIPSNLKKIYKIADSKKISPAKAAIRLAEERVS